MPAGGAFIKSFFYAGKEKTQISVVATQTKRTYKKGKARDLTFFTFFCIDKKQHLKKNYSLS